MNRSRPPALYASPALLIGALIASVMIHVLILSGAGWLHWQQPASLPPSKPLLLQLNTLNNTLPDVPPPRISEQDHSGSGNTLQPNQRQTSRRASHPVMESAPPASARERAAPARLTRPTPTPHNTTPPQPAAAPPSAANAPLNAASLLEQAVQMASLPGENAEQDNHAETGRIKAVFGRNAQGVEWTRYEEDWRLKMERIGTYNFPEEARQQQIYGGPVLTVEINADGSLRSVRVVRGSGHPILDEAAKRIVRMAAPFAPFPQPLANRYSSWEITRKWTFTTDNRLSSQ